MLLRVSPRPWQLVGWGGGLDRRLTPPSLIVGFTLQKIGNRAGARSEESPQALFPDLEYKEILDKVSRQRTDKGGGHFPRQPSVLVGVRIHREVPCVPT